MKKDLLFSAIQGREFDSIEPLLMSLKKAEFAGDVIVLLYDQNEDFINKVQNMGHKVYIPENLNGESRNNNQKLIVVSRFFWQWYLLTQLDISQYRYVLSVDATDILFQYNPSDWLTKNLQEKLLVVGSEGIAYKDEIHFAPINMRDSFGDSALFHIQNNTIYNAGSIAGEASFMKDLFLAIWLMCRDNQHYNPDQAALNLLISMQPYQQHTFFAQMSDAWSCQAGTVAYPPYFLDYKKHFIEKSPYRDKDIIKNANGEPFCLVHQYNRNPDWQNNLLGRYL